MQKSNKKFKNIIIWPSISLFMESGHDLICGQFFGHYEVMDKLFGLFSASGESCDIYLSNLSNNIYCIFKIE